MGRRTPAAKRIFGTQNLGFGGKHCFGVRPFPTEGSEERGKVSRQVFRLASYKEGNRNMCHSTAIGCVSEIIRQSHSMADRFLRATWKATEYVPLDGNGFCEPDFKATATQRDIGCFELHIRLLVCELQGRQQNMCHLTAMGVVSQNLRQLLLNGI